MLVISEYWSVVVVIALGFAGAIAAIVAGRRRARRPTTPAQALRRVCVDSMHDILVPNGMGGQIHVQHLLLTAHGIVVVDVKEVQGMVFGSDRMDEWTVIGARRRFTFPNPQGALYDRVAALRLLVRDVPVKGYVLFGADADFSKGRPEHVLLPDELQTLYQKPQAADLERMIRAFAPHWERIREAAEPARTRGERRRPD